MRVGIDATALLTRKKTGIQFYTSWLIRSLLELVPESPDIELICYFHSGDRHVDAALLHDQRSQFENARVRTWKLARGYRLALPVMAALDRIDLLHLPVPTFLQLNSCPAVVTIHDLCWARLPADIVAGEQMANMATEERAIGMATAMIAVSQNTRRDLLEEYNIAPERVGVTYEGVSELYHPAPAEAERLRSKHQLDRYILYVGTLQRRKNLVRLVEAYAHLLEQHDIPHKLVLAGSKGWGYEEVYAAVERSGVADRIKLLGYVPDEDLPGLYTGADLFIYPSLYEGFGLPVLEAMACGTPIAVSSTSSLPEVAGDAGCFFSPYSVEEIAQAIANVLTDSDYSSELRQKGLRRVKRFTWRETARQTLSIYRDLINKRSLTSQIPLEKIPS
jgi:glycosyltransferase involved in cell wall biosynthesis